MSATRILAWVTVISTSTLSSTQVALGVCTPVEQWRWSAAIQAPDSPDPCISPLVVQLTDDNGDNRIDVSDTPDVIVLHYGPNGRALTALDGATGAVHFSIANLSVVRAAVAAGDVDGDGVVEIILFDWDRMVIYEHDGTLKLVGTQAPFFATDNDTIGLADLDQDGSPEMFLGGSVFNADGSLRFQGSAGLGQEPRYLVAISNAVDLVPSSPGLELLAGRTAYAPDGSVVWDNTSVGDGLTAVADFDGDGDPEIVLTTSTPFAREVYLLDHLGNVLGAPYTIPFGLPGVRRPLSAPLIADFDGDAVPELFIAYEVAIQALRWNGSAFTLMWSQPSSDRTGIDGSAAFDFDGDGAAEIVYHDEHDWFILDGATGTVLSLIPFPTLTVVETPVIADIDNDCLTEILISGCGGGNGSPQAVIAYDCDAGVRARPMWNQHQYHVTNVNDDGTIPTVEAPSWLGGNGWLAQEPSSCSCTGGGTCGNGAVECAESCDDGNTDPCDGCSATCVIEACGDGVVECAELCDDGNTTSCDGCSATCRPETCGDGTLECAESCDDGNTDPCDGCSATCVIEACGDGVVVCSELCDDGNTTSCDGCSATCAIEACGNGVVECSEMCDDGNDVPMDGCTDCQIDVVLSVEWDTVTAICEGRDVRIGWTVTDERGTYGYVVVRASAAEGPFTRLGEPVWADPALDAYELVDGSPVTGSRWYAVEELCNSATGCSRSPAVYANGDCFSADGAAARHRSRRRGQRRTTSRR